MPLLGVCPMKTYVHSRIFMWMFTVDLFIIFFKPKQLGAAHMSPADEGTGQLWCALTMGHNQQQKERTMQTTHTDKNVGASQIHHANWQKPDSRSYLLYGSKGLAQWESQNPGDTRQTRCRSGVGRRFGCRGAGRALWLVGLHRLLTGSGFVTICAYRVHRTVHWKYSFTVGKLYFNKPCKKYPNGTSR